MAICGIMSPNDTVSNVGIIMLQDDIKATVKMALEEDLGGKLDPTLDVTSQLIDENESDEATVITREAGIFCGKAWVEEVYRQLGNKVELTWLSSYSM